MNGAVEGLSQRARPVVCPGAGTGTEGGTGDGGPPDSGGGNCARAIDGTAVNRHGDDASPRGELEIRNSVPECLPAGRIVQILDSRHNCGSTSRAARSTSAGKSISIQGVPVTSTTSKIWLDSCQQIAYRLFVR